MTTGKADSLLFDDVKCDAYGHYGREVSRRLNRRLRAVGITNKRISLYSLRHTFRDACVEAGMPDQARRKMMGHALEGMDGIYGGALLSPSGGNWIDKVAYDGLDSVPTASCGRRSRDGGGPSWRAPSSERRAKGPASSRTYGPMGSGLTLRGTLRVRDEVAALQGRLIISPRPGSEGSS